MLCHRKPRVPGLVDGGAGMSVKNPLKALHDALCGYDDDITVMAVLDAIEHCVNLAEFEKRVVHMIPDDKYEGCASQDVLDLEAKAAVMWYWWRLS